MKQSIEAIKVELGNDIIRHHNSIFYEINSRSKELLDILRCKEDKYSLTKEEFEKIESFLFATSEQRKFFQLGILSKNCEKELEIKREIYHKL